MSTKKNRSHLDSMKTLKDFNESEKEQAIAHICEIVKKDKKNGPAATKVICSVLGYLWLTEEDQYRKDLIAEAAWMGRRMSQKLEKLGTIDHDKFNN